MARHNEIRLFARGGLGNQLFQFGAALNLSKQFSLPIVIDDLFLSSSTFNKKVGYRKIELDSFQNEAQFHNNKHSALNIARSKILSYQRLLGDRLPKLLAKIGYFANENTNQFPIFNQLDRGVAINSYCGHPDFFGNVGAEIVGSVTQIKSPTKWYTDNLSKVLSDSPTGIHLRLGDYKNFPNIYGKPDIKYFSRALEIFKDLNGSRPIWVFSDEPDEARNFFSEVINIDNFVENSVPRRPIEDLNVLAACKNIICSNSSFSWWAGYLATIGKQNANVIFPRPMFVNSKIVEPHNWLLPDWLTLGREI